VENKRQDSKRQARFDPGEARGVEGISHMQRVSRPFAAVRCHLPPVSSPAVEISGNADVDEALLALGVGAHAGRCLRRAVRGGRHEAREPWPSNRASPGRF
jgi:hypothetical protein